MNLLKNLITWKIINTTKKTNHSRMKHVPIGMAGYNYYQMMINDF
ncbi:MULTISPECIES: hypothetical protein [Flavobacterium]|nr:MULTISPECIES: hypothetical protein [Flavobacterium]